MNLTVIPLTSRKKTEKFCFFDELKNIIKSSKVVIKEGDILVISSKFISNSQGRILEIEKSRVCEEAKKIAKQVNKKTSVIYAGTDLCELVG